MAKLVALDEVLKGLDIDPKTKSNIKFSMWQPWTVDEEHADDPQGFVGVYSGYKIAQKDQGKEGVNTFDLFAFDKCKPAPRDGSTGWAVSSSFMLEELKRVEPGVEIAVVFGGSEGNSHGGKTHNVQWFFKNPQDRVKKVSNQALPPSNADKARLLAANSETEF